MLALDSLAASTMPSCHASRKRGIINMRGIGSPAGTTIAVLDEHEQILLISSNGKYAMIFAAKLPSYLDEVLCRQAPIGAPVSV